MKRRYGGLAAAAVALAILLSLLARRPHPRSGAAPPPAPRPAVALALELADGRVRPELSEAPKDRVVELRIVNRGHASADLRLAGYEDRVAVHALAAGAERQIRFLADRPGGDFAWILDGRPAGRFAVTGSHLVEGHR